MSGPPRLPSLGVAARDGSPSSHAPSAGPPLDEPEADQAGGEPVKRREDVSPPLVADREPAEAGEPGQRALHHPTVPAQVLAARSRSPGGRCARRCPACGRRGGSGDSRSLCRRAAWPGACGAGRRIAGPAARRRAPAPAWCCRGRSPGLAPGRAGCRSRRPARASCCPLAARPAAVGRVRAAELAPFWAGTDALSSEHRPQSIAFAVPSRSSSTRWSLAHTPALCQSRKRRQQVMPQPQPISWGSIAQGMPLWSTNRMPASALRSSTGGRPPFGLGRCGGNSGATTAHSLSLTSAFAMPLR